MTLTEFLLARITEDERSAKVARGDFGQPYFPQDVSPTSAGRVLAECAAKRRLVGLHQYDDLGDGKHSCSECDFGGYSRSWCGTLRALTLPYADHPDYRQEWKL